MLHPLRLLPDLALKQALEDGIRIIDGDSLEGHRRSEVLRGLRDVFDGARRGSELVRDHSLFAKAGDKPAFEAFALVSHVLGDDIELALDQTSTRLKILESSKLESDEAVEVRNLLSQLLGAMDIESAFRPLRDQQDFDVMESHAFT